MNAKKVAKYVLLPGIVPRAKGLFTSGFGYVAFLMACVYGIVRLLPQNHPYLQPKNIGLFGVRHVIAEAANNVILNKKNIDQIFVFIILLAGVVLMCLQFVLLIYAYIVQPALATSIFITPEPAAAAGTGTPVLTDIAFLLLDNVFGVPEFFCAYTPSTVLPPAPSTSTCSELLSSGPLPFHVALHGMFSFYSTGILLIAVIVFLYLIIAVVLETATTGTPFGQRFQNIWVPIRLVVALGLLVPLNYGLNSGQYITLSAAKYGSGFATNAWRRFNSTIADNTAVANPTGEEASLVAKPVPPDIATLVQFMSIVHSCAYTYWRQSLGKPDASGSGVIEAVITGSGNTASISTSPELAPNTGSKIQAFLVKNIDNNSIDNRKLQLIEASQTYVDALDFYDNANITIVFGINGTDDDRYNEFTSNIEPTCGKVQIPITDLAHKGEGATVGGADQLQNYYFNLVKGMWFGSLPEVISNGGTGGTGGGGPVGNEALIINAAHRTTELAMSDTTSLQCSIGCSAADLPSCTGSPEPCNREPLNAEVKQNILIYYQTLLNSELDVAWGRYRDANPNNTVQGDIVDRGWGGAGIWFNDIATMNGALMDSTLSVPKPIKYPMLMELTRAAKCTEDSNCGGIDQFKPNSSLEATIKIGLTAPVSGTTKMTKGMNEVFLYWNKEGANVARSDKIISGNIFVDLMNVMFGTEGLFDMRGANSAVHPLAQLTAVGKGLVNSAVNNIAASAAIGATGGPAAIAARLPQLKSMADIISSLMLSTAIVGLTAGFVLFYVLPFLPFVYFYFSVGSWIKGIFEAMVGAPLWALAHLRLDGEGLPGDSATNGYFLIFEIFIRPILTVFGLVAALVIFTAQVRVLNFIWGLVVTNITGYSGEDPTVAIIADYAIPRGIVDQFFFTIIYTIIVYLMAVASFKLIETIPQNILRWMGAGVSSFSDINSDAKVELTRYVALGGLTLGQQAAGATVEFGKGIGGSLAAGAGAGAPQQRPGSGGGPTVSSDAPKPSIKPPAST